MEIIKKRLNVREFEAYVRQYDFGSQPANKLVIHHTWRPTTESWQGERTILGLKHYYEGKNWPTGPHLFIAEDGIWLFTPMRQNGIHAGRLNHRSIGIEVVGDYDLQKWSGKTKENALGAIQALTRQLGIGQQDIFFHRDVSPKSCPGRAITKEWLFQELNHYQPTPRDFREAVDRFSVPAPRFEDALMVPEWAVESVAFVKAHHLFEIRTQEDVRDAVKFHRFYQLIQKTHEPN